MNLDNCPVCTCTLQKGHTAWHFVCKKCKYACSSLLPAFHDEQAYDAIDSDLREIGLFSLRKKNFDQLFGEIISNKASGASLLEIGSAHGWFLEIAKQQYHILGIEPERKMVEYAVNLGLPIRHGFFPEVLQPDERFDIIVFNDVFEHISNVKESLKVCWAHLNKGGLLVLNLPNSRGVIYMLSKMMIKLGFPYFFERMWQKDLPSPHLHYFEHTNLSLLLKNCGFTEIAFGYLEVFHFQGLKERIMACKNNPFYAKIFAYAAAVVLYPLRFLSKDIMYLIVQKDGSL